MKKFLSQSDLNQIYNSEIKKHGKSHVDKLRGEQRPTVYFKEGKSIFLCHSHRDKTIIDKIILLFDRLRIDTYIDWMDNGMPKVTDKNTAKAIKKKIDESSKFLFLATYSALRSKWCNWELGLAYSSKGEKDFAVLPIESRSGKWVGNEYLQLYPEMRIDLGGDVNSIKSSDMRIRFNNEEELSFLEWLNM